MSIALLMLCAALIGRTMWIQGRSVPSEPQAEVGAFVGGLCALGGLTLLGRAGTFEFMVLAVVLTLCAVALVVDRFGTSPPVRGCEPARTE